MTRPEPGLTHSGQHHASCPWVWTPGSRQTLQTGAPKQADQSLCSWTHGAPCSQHQCSPFLLPPTGPELRKFGPQDQNALGRGKLFPRVLEDSGARKATNGGNLYTSRSRIGEQEAQRIDVLKPENASPMPGWSPGHPFPSWPRLCLAGVQANLPSPFKQCLPHKASSGFLGEAGTPAGNPTTTHLAHWRYQEAQHQPLYKNPAGQCAAGPSWVTSAECARACVHACACMCMHSRPWEPAHGSVVWCQAVTPFAWHRDTLFSFVAAAP